LQIRQSPARLCPSPEIRSRFSELGRFRGNSATGEIRHLAVPSYNRPQPRELLSDFRMPLRHPTRVYKQIPVLRRLGMSDRKIAKELRINRCTVSAALKRVAAGGSPLPPTANGRIHKNRQITRAILIFIALLFSLNDTLYIDEVQKLIWEEKGVHVSFQATFRGIKQLHLTRKVVSLKSSYDCRAISIGHDMHSVLLCHCSTEVLKGTPS